MAIPFVNKSQKDKFLEFCKENYTGDEYLIVNTKELKKLSSIVGSRDILTDVAYIDYGEYYILDLGVLYSVMGIDCVEVISVPIILESIDEVLNMQKGNVSDYAMGFNRGLCILKEVLEKRL